jgi:hypothetical protein
MSSGDEPFPHGNITAGYTYHSQTKTCHSIWYESLERKQFSIDDVLIFPRSIGELPTNILGTWTPRNIKQEGTTGTDMAKYAGVSLAFLLQATGEEEHDNGRSEEGAIYRPRDQVLQLATWQSEFWLSIGRCCGDQEAVTNKRAVA